MLAAANRVTAVLSERAVTDGGDDPMVRAMRQLDAALGNVRPDDLRSQRVMTQRLQHVRDRLIEDPGHSEKQTVVAWRKVTGEVLPVPGPTPTTGGGEGSPSAQ